MKRKQKIYGGCILIGVVIFICMIRVQAIRQNEHQPLSGVVITLDAGHGGIDAGAQKDGVKEGDINLSIVQKLKNKIENAGGSVLLTRDGDYDLASDGVDNRKRDDMKKRVTLINEEPCDLFISVHLNSFPNSQVHGAQVFYKKDDDSSKEFAKTMQDKLNQVLEQRKSIKTGDYYILNESKRPGVLVECGYLSNGEERNKLISEEYQEELSVILYESVLVYLEVLSI